MYEQRAIAEVLRTVQQAKEATAKVIAATRQLKASLMRHLFTYGPVPLDQADRVILKETNIGPVPEAWEVRALGGLVEKPQYGLTATATNEPSGPRFLRITDIQDDSVNWTSVPYCGCDSALTLKYRLTPGDIVIARIGATTGKTFLITEPVRAVFASYLIRVRVKNSLMAEYLYQLTKTHLYWDQINVAKGGRLKQGVNIPVLQGLQIPVPPLKEQEQIVHALQVCDDRIAREGVRPQALDLLFKSLLHHLMTGKVRLPEFAETG